MTEDDHRALLEDMEREYKCYRINRGEPTYREFARFVSDELASPPAGPDATVHPSHLVESEQEQMLTNVRCCKRCCRIVWAIGGKVTKRGRDECPGGQRIVLRGDDRLYLVPVAEG